MQLLQRKRKRGGVGAPVLARRHKQICLYKVQKFPAALPTFPSFLFLLFLTLSAFPCVSLNISDGLVCVFKGTYGKRRGKTC